MGDFLRVAVERSCWNTEQLDNLNLSSFNMVFWKVKRQKITSEEVQIEDLPVNDYCRLYDTVLVFDKQTWLDLKKNRCFKKITVNGDSSPMRKERVDGDRNDDTEYKTKM